MSSGLRSVTWKSSTISGRWCAGSACNSSSCASRLFNLKALFKDEWEIYAGQAGVVATLGPPGDMLTAEWMSRRAGTRMETRTSQNEGQGVNTQGVSISSGETVSQTETAFKSPQELMSIRVGTGRIWTPGRGNTSIPFFAPNYWKQPDVKPLIDPNPYSEALNARCRAVRCARPCHANRAGAAAKCGSSPRRNGGAVRRGVAVAAQYRHGMAQTRGAARHACAAPCFALARIKFTRRVPHRGRRSRPSAAPGVAAVRPSLRAVPRCRICGTGCDRQSRR